MSPLCNVKLKALCRKDANSQKKYFMNHAQWDHKYDDCGLTLHFKVGTCGVPAYFLHIPSIFELSTPACLACLSGQLELDNLQIEVSLSHEFA